MKRSDFISSIPLLHVAFCNECLMQIGNGCICALFSKVKVPYSLFQTESQVVFYDHFMEPISEQAEDRIHRYHPGQVEVRMVNE